MIQKFCWKCREYIIEKYGVMAYFPPFQHCHHDEPEEKPKEMCWCEKGWSKIYNGKIYDDFDYVRPKFCPICGRKLGI